MKRKWIKYIIRAVALCLVVWMLLLAIAFFYIKSNKQKIINLIKSDIGQRISGQISFDGLSINFFQNFPGISVDLENVHLADSLFSLNKRELLSVQHLYIGFGILDLLIGKKNPKYITFSNGRIYLFADSTGYKNWNILKKQPGNKSKFDLKKVSLRNINAIFEDVGKFKFYEVWFEKMKCNIHSDADQIKFEMNNEALIKNAFFDTKMGSYLTNKRIISKWDIVYDRLSKKISLQDQIIKINRQSYRISGNFYLGADPYFDLSIETNNLLLKEAASIFPLKTEKKINQFRLSKPLTGVRAFLSGPMKYSSIPVTKIYCSSNDASLEVSPVQFEHCSFNVFFNNENDSTKSPSDYNSVIQFTDVKGEWQKNSFAGQNILFYNLVHPYLKCGIHFIFKLTQIKNAIASSRLDFNNGDGEAVLDYAGPVAKADTGYNLNGKIIIQNGDITYNPRNLNFKKTEIELVFQSGDMLVNKMNTEINNDKIKISGRVKDFLNFFNTDSSKVNFEWNIYSPHIDIGKLTSSLHRNTLARKKQGYSFFDRLNNKIDRLFDDCNAYLNIQADKLVYKKFLATNVNGRLTLRNDMIGLTNFSLQHANGSITVNASSKDNGRNSDLVLQSKMQNVDVKELFAAFNSFGMQSLRSENINGRFSADVNLTSMLDANNNLYKPANKGYVKFSLENGRLENFKPLMEIDNNFLQKRDLSNVGFAELKDRFDINGNDIKINRMEIKSTAVNMYVEGIYSFADNTDLSIQIPLHRQMKDSDVVPDNKGNNSKGGISIFLRAKDDKDGKLKISYDLLGRFRNKK